MTNLISVKNYASQKEIESTEAVQGGKIVKVYEIARPILVFIGGFFIVPKKVRTIISNLVTVLDVVFEIVNNENQSNDTTK
jgi:hypothetical protein